MDGKIQTHRDKVVHDGKGRKEIFEEDTSGVMFSWLEGTLVIVVLILLGAILNIWGE